MKRNSIKENLSSINGRLRYLRKKEKLTLEELAERTGLSVSSLQRYEVEGLTVMNNEYLVFMYKLGYNLNWILTGEESEKRKEDPKSLITDVKDTQVRLHVLENQVKYLTRMFINIAEERSNFGERFVKHSINKGTE